LAYVLQPLYAWKTLRAVFGKVDLREKPKARLRLYRGGRVEAKLDLAWLKISGPRCRHSNDNSGIYIKL
jgi:hypothetical protein